MLPLFIGLGVLVLMALAVTALRMAVPYRPLRMVAIGANVPALSIQALYIWAQFGGYSLGLSLDLRRTLVFVAVVPPLTTLAVLLNSRQATLPK